MTRRDALRFVANGFGMMGLAGILHGETEMKGPLAVKPPHFSAKAKNVIFLFLNGGFSQVDTFDPKPMLDKHHGEPMPGPTIKTDRASGNLMRSPWRECPAGTPATPETYPHWPHDGRWQWQPDEGCIP